MTALSADRPSSNPQDDLFGHAPFAESLANSICRYPGNDGLVLALYGPWGSGKSTVLSYVRHFLEQSPEAERPVIVTFNPWWFSGQENLARAFLGQLQAVLPAKSEKFKKLGDLLGDFAEGVGGLIDLSGITGGAGSKIGKLIGLVTKRKPKDKKWPSLFEQQNRIYKWKLCGLKKWNRERVVHGAWLWTTRWPYTQSLKRVVHNCEAHGGQPGACCGHHAAGRMVGSSFA